MAANKTMIALLAAALALAAPPAAAQPVDDGVRAAARELAQQGGALFEAGDHAGALDKLDRAYAVLRVPTLGYWSARSMEHLGRWVEAAERYLEVTRLPVPATGAELHEKAQRDAGAARAELLPRIPRLAVVLEGEGAGQATVTVDGDRLPAPLVGTAMLVDPGKRQVVAAIGERRVTRTVSVSEGKTERVVIELPAGPAVAPPAPPAAEPGPAPARGGGQAGDAGSASNGLRTAGWVSLGAGALFAAGGAACGIALLVIDADLGERCVDERCTPSASDDVDVYNALRPLTTVGLVVGAAGLGLGLTLLLIEPGDGGASVSLQVGPSGAAWRGRF